MTAPPTGAPLTVMPVAMGRRRRNQRCGIMTADRYCAPIPTPAREAGGSAGASESVPRCGRGEGRPGEVRVWGEVRPGRVRRGRRSARGKVHPDREGPPREGRSTQIGKVRPDREGPPRGRSAQGKVFLGSRSAQGASPPKGEVRPGGRSAWGKVRPGERSARRQVWVRGPWLGLGGVGEDVVGGEGGGQGKVPSFCGLDRDRVEEKLGIEPAPKGWRGAGVGKDAKGDALLVEGSVG